jgi:hypothetical protein
MILHEIIPNPKLQWLLKCIKVEKFLFWRPVTFFLSTCSVLPPGTLHIREPRYPISSVYIRERPLRPRLLPQSLC